MAKGILEFDLDCPHDRVTHLRATKSLELALVIHELDNELRRVVNYETDQVADAADKWRSILFELCARHNVDIDELLE